MIVVTSHTGCVSRNDFSNFDTSNVTKSHPTWDV